MPATYSQETDKDSLNAEEEAGPKGHSKEKAERLSWPSP